MTKLSEWFSSYLKTHDMRNETHHNPAVNGFSIKQIFLDFWHIFLIHPSVKRNGIRDCTLKEVAKMMGCGDYNNGFSLFECPFCQRFIRVAFSCKSRFCNSCGVVYSKNRANTIAKKALNVNHRHVVFTIDDQLRYYFKKDRKLLNCLFKAVEQTLFYSVRLCGRKSENLKPGFIMVLHTFGRDLKWNPHIHCLLTEGGMTAQGHYKHLNYINYERLRKSFMRCLFAELQKHIDVFGSKDVFYRIKKQSYKNHKNGFYVYAPPQRFLRKNSNGQKQVIQYILRYTGRPVMAQSRIEAYDKQSQIIQYWYQPHDSKEIVHVTENVLMFIGKLVIHIQESHFKTIRYAGIYAAKDHAYRQSKKRYEQKQAFETFIHRFRASIIKEFKRDPLLCICGNVMELVEIFLPNIDTLEEVGT